MQPEGVALDELVDEFLHGMTSCENLPTSFHGGLAAVTRKIRESMFDTLHNSGGDELRERMRDAVLLIGR